MTQSEGLRAFTIPAARKLADQSAEKGPQTLAIQSIRDSMEASAVLEVAKKTDVSGATYAIATSGKLQLNLVDNADADAPDLLGNIQINPAYLSQQQREVLALSQQLARGFVPRFEAALGRLDDASRKLALIDLMTEIAVDANVLMEGFVGQQIFRIESEIPALMQGTRSKFDEWSDQLSEFES